ncbi:rRNA methylase [Acidilobus saccharovorans 345-15]|uniref:rRNA methylase n=1 Tax=Acidilobus saccharovorans (strain DSM 16705 / JCM 18335 / VKM B-2471 / 345-15) TaxID=666510 RepID=D9Q0L4_ACIS3|nr:rRNA methylase [Acidilobus saccharovorans 345-15]
MALRLRLVAVGIEGPVNLGYIFRLSENFEVDELYLVSPTASVAESLRWAAKASDMAWKATVVGSLKEALRDVELSVCTSDESSARDLLRSPVSPEQAAELMIARKGTVALVVGRESVGLTRDELAQCDLLCTIPASPKYTALNVSNATAVLLYEIYKARRKSPEYEPPSRKTIALAEAYARSLAAAVGSSEDDPGLSVRRLLSKATAAEARHLLNLLSKACSSLGCRDMARRKLEELCGGPCEEA